MSLRDDLAGVLARDPRYSIQAYVFIFEAIEYTKNLKKRRQSRIRARGKASPRSRHVSGRELCEGARALALDHYGLVAMTVLDLWGSGSGSGVGEVGYSLVGCG